MPPLPKPRYTRDTTCWVYGGVTLDPLYWPARKDESLLMMAVYTFHPGDEGSTVWWGDPEQDWARRPSRAATPCPSATARSWSG
ncbi:arginine deiminase family protein [Puerhibacterium sp. TATVAM-FAB25]